MSYDDRPRPSRFCIHYVKEIEMSTRAVGSSKWLTIRLKGRLGYFEITIFPLDLETPMPLTLDLSEPSVCSIKETRK